MYTIRTNSRRHLHVHSAAHGDLQVLACRTSTFGPLCPKTVELFTVVTSGSNTNTHTHL